MRDDIVIRGDLIEAAQSTSGLCDKLNIDVM